MFSEVHIQRRVGFVKKFGNASYLTVSRSALLAAALTMGFSSPEEARGQGFSWENAAGLNGGAGTRDATGSKARFDFPLGVVFSPATGTLFVCDYNNRGIRQVTTGGAVTTFSGTTERARAYQAAHVDGPLADARFTWPNGIAVAANGDLYITDYTTIRRIVAATNTVQTLAGTNGVAGTADGPGQDALFWGSSGIAVTPDGRRVFVADTTTCTIRQIDRSVSPPLVTTIAGAASTPGFVDGPGADARFRSPAGLAWKDSTNELFVADSENLCIRRVTAPLGGPVTVDTLVGGPGTAGQPQADGAGPAVAFFSPTGIALHPSGDRLMVIDEMCIREITLNTPLVQVTRRAGQFTSGPSTSAGAGTGVEGPGLSITFDPSRSISFQVSGLTYDAAGNLIMAESSENQLLRLTPAFEVTTLAGRATTEGMIGGSYETLPYFANGTAGTSRVWRPLGMDSDAAGNVFFVDTGNSAIRRIDAANGSVSTLAGFGPHAPQTQFHRTYYDLAVSGTTMVYTLPGEHQIVSDTTTGGSPFVLGDSTDGFSMPGGVDIDAAGVVFVTDMQGNVIRSIMPNGTITTIAGSGALGFADGTGAAATFGRPTDVVVRPDGVLFVADNFYSIIRMLTPGPLGPLGPYDVTTLSGTPNVTVVNDGPVASATYYSPEQLALDAGNRLYITDTGSGLIRRFDPATGRVTTIAGDVSLGSNLPIPGNQGGFGPNAIFTGVRGIAITPAGDVFASSHLNGGIWRGVPDSIPPITTITHAPGSPTFAQTANFTFTASEPECLWEVSFDGGQFLPTTGRNTHEITGLSDASHTVVFRAMDAAGNFEVTPVSHAWTIQSYSRDWRTLHFGGPLNEGDAADSADPDSDGIDNLLERAFGLKPNNPSTLPIQAARSPAGTIIVTYTRRIEAKLEIKTLVRWSDALAANTWSHAGVVETIVSTAGNTETVEATVPAGLFRRFIRIDAELLPPP